MKRTAKLQSKAGEKKKKRGRKARPSYLEESLRDLEKMREFYMKENKKMDVKTRAKARNRISAFESRIKKRQY